MTRTNLTCLSFAFLLLMMLSSTSCLDSPCYVGGGTIIRACATSEDLGVFPTDAGFFAEREEVREQKNTDDIDPNLVQITSISGNGSTAKIVFGPDFGGDTTILNGKHSPTRVKNALIIEGENLHRIAYFQLRSTAHPTLEAKHGLTIAENKTSKRLELNLPITLKPGDWNIVGFGLQKGFPIGGVAVPEIKQLVSKRIVFLEGENRFTPEERQQLKGILTFIKQKQGTSELTFKAEHININAANLLKLVSKALSITAKKQVHLDIGTSNNGQFTSTNSFDLSAGIASFEKLNVSLSNGEGSTDKVNAQGNLFLGYNKLSNNQQQTGSHNLIMGDEHTFTSHSGMVLGKNNQITNMCSAVTAGSNNIASGKHSNIVGGKDNKVSGTHSTVLGGVGTDLKDNESIGFQ